MSKLPISVCIIAKNEEKYIEGCLQHLKPYGFEIVVADTGSTDRTKEIAEKYADTVVDFEWIDDFSAARNFCAEHATNNWILSLDCDEYLESFDYKNIRILTQKLPRCVGRFPLKNLVMGNDGIQRYTIDTVTRFYNKKRFFWTEPIHEQLVRVEDPTNLEYPCFDMPMEVVHHGYNISGDEMVEKQLRNLRLLGKQLERDPQDPYIWFQIGQSQFVLMNYEKSVDAYEMALSFNPSTERFFVEILIESLSKAYLNVNRAQDAVNLLLKYSETYKTAKFEFALAGAYFENNQKLQALMHFIKATTMKDRDELGDGLLACYGNIICIYREMGQEDMANMYVDLFEKCRLEREKILNS